MSEEATSRHLRGATELMLVVPIRSGFVKTPMGSVSVAFRLKTLLDTLYELRRKVVEEEVVEGKGPIESLRSIYTTQWAVVEDAVDPKLILTACFDRSWEDYVSILVQGTGDLLDAIFCHCVGFGGRSCAEGFESFSSFLREHQLPVSFFHTGMPDMTIDDIRLARKQRKAPATSMNPADVTIGSPIQEGEGSPAPDLLKETTLDPLKAMFPDVTEFGDKGGRTAKVIYENAMLQLSGRKAAKAVAPAADPVTLGADALGSIQGGILRGYDKQTHGCALLIAYDGTSSPQALLGHLSTLMTTEARATQVIGDKGTLINVFLTHAGLRRLGLDDATLALFPKEFREGMQGRAGLVGDVGPNAAVRQQLPKANASGAPGGQDIPLESVDVVVVLQRYIESTEPDVDWAPPNHPLYPDVTNLALGEHGGRLLHVQTLRRRWEKEGENAFYREHFGFRDSGNPSSGSQPVPNASFLGSLLVPSVPDRDRVNLGEFLLGYPDALGGSASAAAKNAVLFTNSTFLVMRKLEQDAAAFNAFAAANADRVAQAGRCPFGTPPATAATIKALVVGREFDSGRSLTGAADNDFSFAGEASPGERVPLHAHIRRANPRTTGPSPIPRILRRGFAYGRPYVEGDASSDRGLLFMAYNANIGRQFEVVQRWLNGGNSTGLSSAENDVLTGVPQGLGVKRWVNANGPLALDDPAKELVTLRWGFYLFAPSKDALQLLASGNPAPGGGASVSDLDAGRQLLARLSALEGENQRRAWQQILEAREYKLEAKRVWEAIRVDEGGVFDAGSYGLLVGTVEGATVVLGDDGRKFSAREYWQRLGESIGEHYLGFDPRPGAMPAAGDRDVRFEAKSALVEYAQLSTDPNAYIMGLPAESAYQLALGFARRTLAEIKQLLPGPMDLAFFASATVGRLAHAWIGTPLPDDCFALDMARFTANFATVSVSTFQTYPDEALRAEARKCGQTLHAAYAGQRGRMKGMASTLTGKNQEQVELAMIGAIVGFAAPAIECIVSTIVQSMNTGNLGTLQELGAVPTEERKTPLLLALTEVLSIAPVPSILYRTALAGAVVGGHTASAGSLVVVGLQSVCADAGDPNVPLRWMFGGDHGGVSGAGPPHGCPARNLVLQALAGVLAAVVELEDVKPEGATSISFGVPKAYLP